MITYYLQFANREEALSILSLLNYNIEQQENGKQIYSSGLFLETENTRFYLDFLYDSGAIVNSEYDLVNLLWPENISLPTILNDYTITPITPSCVFVNN